MPAHYLNFQVSAAQLFAGQAFVHHSRFSGRLLLPLQYKNPANPQAFLHQRSANRLRSFHQGRSTLLEHQALRPCSRASCVLALTGPAQPHLQIESPDSAHLPCQYPCRLPASYLLLLHKVIAVLASLSKWFAAL